MCGFAGYVISKALLRSGDEKANKFLDTCVTEYLKLKDLLQEPVGEKRLSGRRVLWTLLQRGQQPEGSKERCWDWRDPKGPFIEATLDARGNTYNGYPVDAGYFGSYAPDALAIALHSVYHTDSFMEAISKCVHFLGDADSTGSVTGQLAGAFYGFNKIDKRCIANLNKWDDGQVAARGALLYILGD